MKEILVDTNVVVSFLTDRNKDQQERAAALLDRHTPDVEARLREAGRDF